VRTRALKAREPSLNAATLRFIATVLCCSLVILVTSCFASLLLTPFPVAVDVAFTSCK